jgi:hypothetical protein
LRLGVALCSDGAYGYALPGCAYRAGAAAQSEERTVSPPL